MNSLRFTTLILFILLTVNGCEKNENSNRKNEVLDFVIDKMEIPVYKDSSHPDTLLQYFYPPVDSTLKRFFHQTWIAWGKLPRIDISCNQYVHQKSQDGDHYFLIVSLMRPTEFRSFKYLVEVFDDGTKLWLKQFFMFDTKELGLFNHVKIRKKKGRVIWSLRFGPIHGEVDGRGNIKTSAKLFPPW